MRNYLTLILIIATLCLAPAALGQSESLPSGEQRPSANGPMRLGDDPAPPDEQASERTEAERSRPDDSPQRDTPGDEPVTPPHISPTQPEAQDAPVAQVDDDVDAGTSPQRRESDAQPLGTPNGVFSARPVESDDESSDSKETPSSWMGSLDPRRNDFVRVLGALAIVLGLLLLIRVVIRKAPGLGGGFRPSGVVEVLARYPVGRGQQLIILKLARRVILLHHAGNLMRTLTTIEDPNEVASLLARMESGASGRGKTVFKGVLGRYLDEHKRAMHARRGKNQYWADDVDTGEIVDLTRSSNGNGAAKRPAAQSNEVVTRRSAARRMLLRR